MVRGVPLEKAKTKLQKVRIKAGLSQLQLATKAGITERVIQCYEQQEYPIERAKIETLCNICISLDCKMEDILEDTEILEKYKKIK